MFVLMAITFITASIAIWPAPELTKESWLTALRTIHLVLFAFTFAFSYIICFSNR
jgi:hypothetical protein